MILNINNDLKFKFNINKLKYLKFEASEQLSHGSKGK